MSKAPVVRSSATEAVWKVWLPLGLGLLTVILGIVGFRELFGVSLWDAFFLAIGLTLLESSSLDPGTQAPVILNIARVTGFIVLFYAIALGYAALFGDIIKPLRIRSWSLPGRRRGGGHVVVCGLGWKGAEIVGDLLAKDHRVAVIEPDPDNRLLPTARELGAVILEGDATQLPLLRAAHIRGAEKVFLVSESDETNVRILKQIAALLEGHDTSTSPLQCNVEMHDPRMREFVHRLLAAVPNIYLNTFDTFEATARQLLQAYPIDRFEGGVVEAHVVIIGLTPMARATLQQALLVGHFPAPRRLRITVFTNDATAVRADFLRQHPCFHPDAFAENPSAQRLQAQVLPRVDFVDLPESDLLLLHQEEPLLRTICRESATSFFVCLDDGLRSASYASAILPSVAAAARSQCADVQVAYYYNYPEDEHRNLVERNLRELAPSIPVRAFGNFLEGCSIDRVEGRPVDDIARQLAAYYREEFGGEGWHELSEADRMSNRHAADHLPVKLRSIGVEITHGAADATLAIEPAEVALLGETEHRRWCAEKLLTGWRPLPRTADNEALWQESKKELKAQKLHIDLVPFDELSDQDRQKDDDQIRNMPRLVGALGMGTRRLPSTAPKAG